MSAAAVESISWQRRVQGAQSADAASLNRISIIWISKAEILNQPKKKAGTLMSFVHRLDEQHNVSLANMRRGVVPLSSNRRTSTNRQSAAQDNAVLASPPQRGIAAEIKRVGRYLVVGGGANCFALAVYYALTFGLQWPPEVAFTLASGLALLLSYAVNRAWTFGATAGSPVLFMRYVVGYACSFALQWTILYVGVHHFGLAHWWMVLFALATATVFFYALQRLWVFSMKQRRVSESAP